MGKDPEDYSQIVQLKPKYHETDNYHRRISRDAGGSRHCRFALSVRPVSECAAPDGNGIGNPARKSEDSGKKKEDGSRPAKAATAHRTSSTPIQAAGTTTAYATLRYGSVGIPEGKTADNPEDNIFEINLSRTIPSDARVWLCYELQGADHSGAVAKSINDRPATGGYMAASSDGWTRVREEIHPAWLHEGVNRVLFTAPEGRSYSVRNLHVETASGPGQALTLSQTPVVYGDLAYVHGFVRNGARTVKAGHTVLTLQDGEFEGIVPVSGSSLTLSAITASGKALTASFPTLKKDKADYERAFQTPAARTAGKHFAQDKADSLKMPTVRCW